MRDALRLCGLNWARSNDDQRPIVLLKVNRAFETNAPMG